MNSRMVPSFVKGFTQVPDRMDDYNWKMDIYNK
jgi:hypothetical protein